MLFLTGMSGFSKANAKMASGNPLKISFNPFFVRRRSVRNRVKIQTFWRREILGSAILCSILMGVGISIFSIDYNKIYERNDLDQISLVISDMIREEIREEEIPEIEKILYSVGRSSDVSIVLHAPSGGVMAAYPQLTDRISKKVEFSSSITKNLATDNGKKLGSVVISKIKTRQPIWKEIFLSFMLLMLVPLLSLLWIIFRVKPLIVDISKIGSDSSCDDFRFEETLKAQQIIFEQSKQLTTNKVSQAIVQTTQMLAHDLRKPFSMLQGVLSMISQAETIHEVRAISQESTPEIERGISSVNGMIQDIMKVGSNNQLSQEDVNPETLVENAVNDSLRYIEKAQINLSYDFHHDRKLSVDILKAARVFSNIVSNGAQAMNYRGDMWFKTQMSNNGFIHFTIGNSHSYIPAENIERLFDAFLTSGKKGGTGLGLAIVKKLVSDHGGDIWCTSTKGKGTEFHFTLPLSDTKSDYIGELPTCSEAIRSSMKNSAVSFSGKTKDANEVILEKAIIKELQTRNRSISVLVVDDEKLYTTVLKNQLTRNDLLASHISICEASSGEDALILAIQRKFDIIILDVEMGKNKLSGFDTALKMRKMGEDATICIHSNRGGSEYYKEAMDKGADLFISKTMPREHFLRMIYGVFGDPHKLLSSGTHKTATDAIPKVVVVEDNKIFRRAWKQLSQDIEVSTYDCPDSLLAELDSDPGVLDNAQAVVIDNNYGDLSDMTGFDLAKSLMDKGIHITKAVATGEHLSSKDIDGVFDLIIPKSPADGIKELYKHLSGT